MFFRARLWDKKREAVFGTAPFTSTTVISLEKTAKEAIVPLWMVHEWIQAVSVATKGDEVIFEKDPYRL